MSRKEIALPQGGLLVVGWDRPLATFYAQVFKPGTTDICRDDMCFTQEHTRRDCQDDVDLIDPWFGCEYAELPTLEDLERALGDLAGCLEEATKAELLEAQRTEGYR